MELNNRDTSVLQHIIEHAYEVEGTLKQFHNSREIFDKNYIFRNALSMSVFAITELTKHLTDDFKEHYSAIPWRDISAMRNNFAHHYNGINWNMVWNTAIQDIPEISQFCKSVLADNGRKIPDIQSINEIAMPNEYKHSGK